MNTTTEQITFLCYVHNYHITITNPKLCSLLGAYPVESWCTVQIYLHKLLKYFHNHLQIGKFIKLGRLTCVFAMSVHSGSVSLLLTNLRDWLPDSKGSLLSETPSLGTITQGQQEVQNYKQYSTKEQFSWVHIFTNLPKKKLAALTKFLISWQGHNLWQHPLYCTVNAWPLVELCVQSSMEALRLTSTDGLCRGVKQSIFGDQCMLFAHNLALWMVLSTVCVTMCSAAACSPLCWQWSTRSLGNGSIVQVGSSDKVTLLASMGGRILW